MLVITLVIPSIMFGCGRYFVKNAGSRESNTAFGYRTVMSMKNKDTWNFAHNYCGKLWRVIGGVMLPLSGVFMFFLIGQETVTVLRFGGMLCVVQGFSMVMALCFTERALKKKFIFGP